MSHVRNHRRYRVLGLSCILVLAALLGQTAARAQTAEPGSYFIVTLSGGDSFVNYDHKSAGYGAGNVDWPVTMFFANNAEVDYVKSLILSNFPTFQRLGGAMYLNVNDGSGASWDSDSGIKDPVTSCPVNVHMRVYADSDDRMWNSTNGYYVLGTTHWDQYENCPGDWFGASEIASDAFANMYGGGLGLTVSANNYNFANVEPDEWQGNHFMQSNGRAHIVHV